jgi:hypothetical protein
MIKRHKTLSTVSVCLDPTSVHYDQHPSGSAQDILPFLSHKQTVNINVKLLPYNVPSPKW